MPTINRPTVRRVKVYYGLTLPQITRLSPTCTVPVRAPQREQRKMAVIELSTPDAYELERIGDKAAALRPIYGEVWNLLREKAHECGGTARFISAEVVPIQRSWYIREEEWEEF